MKPSPIILIVDDEPSVRRAHRRRLVDGGFSVVEASSAGEAMQVLDREPVHAIVSDFDLPGLDGGELLERVRQWYPHIPRLMVAGSARERPSAAQYSFDKPGGITEAVATLASLLQHRVADDADSDG